jgi:hypothetical protein
VREQMSPTGVIVVKTDHLMADRTFRVERVKSPPSQELYKLDNPHGKNTQGRLVVVSEFGIPQQLTRAEIMAVGPKSRC